MDPVFLITGAASGIGAATARLAAEAGLPRRARRPLRGQARRSWPARPAASPSACDVTGWDDQQALVAARARRVRADRRRLRQRRRRPRRAGSRRATRSDGKQMILTNVYGTDAHDPGRARAAAREPRAPGDHVAASPAAARSRARSTPRPSSPTTGMAEAARQDFNGTGVRVTLIEPGHGRDAGLLSTRDRGDARAARRRPRRPVRDRAARRTSTSTRSSCARRSRSPR